MAETLTDLRDAPVLTGVGDGPQRAAREWQRLGVRRELARFDPVVVSSLASGLDTDGSDLDVVCDLRQPGLVERAHAAYGTRHGFAAWTTNDRTLVTFFGEKLQVELVGEARPVEAQAAYRHAVAHRRLVEIGGGRLAARVRGLRRDFALKTEPALAVALDLAGDPYKSIARLASAPTAELERLVDRQFPLRSTADSSPYRAPTVEEPSMSRILITGARGKTGASLAERLAGRAGIDVLGGSSDPSTVTIDGVRPTALSWDDPSGWPAATDGVDAVYVVRPDRADAPELVAGMVAETPTDAHVVLLSGQEVDASPPDGWALRTEHAVRDSGRAWTVLRPGWFMQVFTDARFFRDQIVAGKLPFSSGGAGVAWIDTRDIAAVADRVLLEPGHAGRIYKLSGPEAVTLPRTAQLLSRTLGRPVTHVELTIDEAVTGMQGFDRQQSAATFERLHAGVYAEVTDTVARVTGRPARTLQTFLADAGPITASSEGTPSS